MLPLNNCILCTCPIWQNKVRHLQREIRNIKLHELREKHLNRIDHLCSLRNKIDRFLHPLKFHTLSTTGSAVQDVKHVSMHAFKSICSSCIPTRHQTAQICKLWKHT